LAKRRQAKRNEVLVESDISMYIPEDYIDDENARLEIYKKMSSVNSTDELKEISEELVDRFGKLPAEVESLVKHIELKLLLSQNGFEKLSISGDVVELFFDLENQDIYTSGYFEKVMNRISQDFKNTSRVKQTKKSLSIQFRLPKYENSDEKLAEIHKFVHILAGLK
ncbi:MAG TPA: hypothetical protein PKA39_15195, partial [Ignavibacteria bacterium]|nr:hypothetical protein [Ignavibacteria bacterium]